MELFWDGVDRIEGKERTLAIVWHDSRNGFSWLRKGKARTDRPRRILVACLIRRIYRNIEVIPLYIRTYYNLSDDLITMDGAKELNDWVTRFSMKAASVPWRWRNFCRLGYKVR